MWGRTKPYFTPCLKLNNVRIFMIQSRNHMPGFTIDVFMEGNVLVAVKTQKSQIVKVIKATFFGWFNMMHDKFAGNHLSAARTSAGASFNHG